MAYPELQPLDYSYTGFAAGQGDNSFPGTQIDNDLANLHAGVASTNAFLGAAFRSDGVLNVSAMPDIQPAIDAAAASAASAATSATTATTKASAADASAVSAATAAADLATAVTQAQGYAQAASDAAADAAGVDPGLLALNSDNLSTLTDFEAARINLGVNGALAAKDTVGLSDLVAAVANALVPTGAFMTFLRSSVPTGWVENGTTVGNASSGADRANADTQALFNLLWAELDDTTGPLLTAAGGASARGADAATDWAANKRLKIVDARGEFIRIWDHGRGVDSGRAIGSAQSEMIGPHGHTASTTTAAAGGHTPTGSTSTTPDHTHTTTSPAASSNQAGYATASSATTANAKASGAAGAHSHTLTMAAVADHTHTATTTINNNTGTENRVRNIALLACVKL